MADIRTPGDRTAGKATRLFAHLFARSTHAAFPEAGLARITAAIEDAESQHDGEICFAVESNLAPSRVFAGVDARSRAAEVFAQLRVWDTQANNGVLVYLLLADRRIEIVADRGLDGRVDAADWRAVCVAMEQRLAAGDPVGAACTGVASVAALLAAHFPHAQGESNRNELPDRPVLLD